MQAGVEEFFFIIGQVKLLDLLQAFKFDPLPVSGRIFLIQLRDTEELPAQRHFPGRDPFQVLTPQNIGQALFYGSGTGDLAVEIIESFIFIKIQQR